MPDFPIWTSGFNVDPEASVWVGSKHWSSGPKIAILAIEESFIEGSEFVLDGDMSASKIEIQNTHSIAHRIGVGWWLAAKVPLPVATNILP